MKRENFVEKCNTLLSTPLSDEDYDTLLKIIDDTHIDNVRIKVHGMNGDENAFLEACKPLMKYLCENHHPHVKVIIDGTRAELLEGLKTISYDNFVLD